MATNAAADSLHDSGGLVLSDQSNATNLLNAGYVRIGQVTTDVDGWQLVGSAPPAARSYHTAVWTGSEMIIWGGNGTPFGKVTVNTGARFNPVTGIWTPVTTNGAPSPRESHTAIWTGSEMIVWGGDVSIFSAFQPGGRYDPVSDRWQPTSTSNAPTARYGHTAVWTGSEMIVWGGATTNGVLLGTGGRYHPLTDTWTATAANNLAPPRLKHTAVWTGNEMIVWGGTMMETNRDARRYSNTGARYDPATDSWLAMSVNGQLIGRELHAAIWTGSEMIVWGGEMASTSANGSGARYNPTTDSWLLVSTVNPPRARRQPTAVWTGTEMIIWGGLGSSGPNNTGGRYSPTANTWTATSTNYAPDSRTAHTAVWTGTEMIVWGGTTDIQGVPTLNGNQDTGGRYNPSTDSWTTTTMTPTGRIGHTAVWTGSEMIIWGGTNIHYNGSTSVLRSLGTGARFNPVTSSWTAVSTDNAPTPRQNHTAVWTGTEMIVCGGFGYTQVTNISRQLNPTVLGTGGRYNPVTDTWREIEPLGPLQGRTAHTAVWTGEEMIIWGGISTNVNLIPTVFLNNGARYNASLDTWTTISSIGAPAARTNHAVVWTGREMIIWGGVGRNTDNRSVSFNSGARYTPAMNNWKDISTTGAPPAIGLLPLAVWTGHEMIIWLGRPYHDPPYGFGFGGRYRPDKDSWSPIYWDNARDIPTGVWTGNEMIVWDGQFVGRSDPTFDGWTRRTLPGAPAARTGATAVWTGNSVLLFGGSQSVNFAPVYPGDVYAYSLTRPMYLYQKQ